MDPGTNAREVLEGQAVRLKHGWIGIVNRGQADIMSKVRLALTARQATLGVWQCWQLISAGSLSSLVERWNEVTFCRNLSRLPEQTGPKDWLICTMMLPAGCSSRQAQLQRAGPCATWCRGCRPPAPRWRLRNTRSWIWQRACCDNSLLKFCGLPG